MGAPTRRVREIGGVWEGFDNEVEDEYEQEERNNEKDDGEDGGEERDLGINRKGVNLPINRS